MNETLEYTVENTKYIKTSVDIMEAIKYNDMEITAIYKALEWKETVKKLFEASKTPSKERQQ